MATTKALIYGPALVATGPVTLFTTPANEVDVVTIWVNNPTVSAVSLTVSIGADAAATRIIGTNTAANIPANSTSQFGPFVIPASTAVTASTGTNNALNISFHGEKRTPG